MNPIYKFLAIPSVFVSGLIVFFSGLLSLAISFGDYPQSVLVFIPWYLGVCGVAGLLAAFGNPRSMSPLQLAVRIALLGCGIVGSVIFCVLLIGFVGTAHGPGSEALGAELVAVALVFPVLPVCAAVVALRSLLSAWSGGARAVKGVLLHTCALVISPLLLLLSARILGQEAGMLWYGHDLARQAQESAGLVANGSPYCVMDSSGTTSLAELPVRKILLRAFDNRFGAGDRTFFIEPHFLIAVNGAHYWWSFRQDGFVPVPPHVALTLPAGTCPGLTD